MESPIDDLWAAPPFPRCSIQSHCRTLILANNDHNAPEGLKDLTLGLPGRVVIVVNSEPNHRGRILG